MRGPLVSRPVAGVTAYVVAAGAGLTALVASGADLVAVVVLALAATVGLVAILSGTLGRISSTARRLAGDTGVIVDANPSHRLEPATAGELAALATAVNRLADDREAVRREAAEQAQATRRDVESERNRLAALMAQLTVAVVVCNGEGRVLLYNQAARAMAGDAAPLGLGRSVFGLVDRGLLAHALDRLRARDETAYTATTLHGDKLLRVRVSLVAEPGTDDPAGRDSGFVLVLEDLTREIRAGDERERRVRELAEGARASLASIRAATESLLDFPDLTDAERQRFLEIVHEETGRLAGRVDEAATESWAARDDRLVAEITGDDLLVLVADELMRSKIASSPPRADEHVWLHADGHAMARCVVHLTTRLRDAAGLDRATLSLTSSGRHAQLDVSWRGSAPPTSVVEAWLDEPLEGAGSRTVREVVDRHGAGVWCGETAEADGGWVAYLRVLLPLAAGAEPAARTPRPTVESRPEFYDFDLFTARSQPADLADRRLEQLAFTVFDTETTGLDPVGGDRIISIGAVRVVNGRVLRQETFERLVQPQRSVPAASTAIHGITAAMLEGEPPIAEVLPTFARFAEDTVLVGHNVGFDLQFLKLAGTPTGIDLSRPALDTLLLHAALHPDNEEHTLEAIAARLGVSVVGRHTALGDALVTAEVFVALVAMLRQRGIDTLGGALAASRQTFQARVDERLYGG